MSLFITFSPPDPNTPIEFQLVLDFLIKEPGKKSIVCSYGTDNHLHFHALLNTNVRADNYRCKLIMRLKMKEFIKDYPNLLRVETVRSHTSVVMYILKNLKEEGSYMSVDDFEIQNKMNDVTIEYKKSSKLSPEQLYTEGIIYFSIAKSLIPDDAIFRITSTDFNRFISSLIDEGKNVIYCQNYFKIIHKSLSAYFDKEIIPEFIEMA